jgi:hypothetical protein
MYSPKNYKNLLGLCLKANNLQENPSPPIEVTPNREQGTRVDEYISIIGAQRAELNKYITEAQTQY